MSNARVLGTKEEAALYMLVSTIIPAGLFVSQCMTMRTLTMNHGMHHSSLSDHLR